MDPTEQTNPTDVGNNVGAESVGAQNFVPLHYSPQQIPQIPPITIEQWEKNHQNITRCISDHIRTYGRLPTHQEMAARTDMTGEEVGKHLEQFTRHSSYGEEIELMRMMVSEVLAVMGHLAANGDINAAKLYTQMLEEGYQKPAEKPVDEGPSGVFAINGVNMFHHFLKYLQPDEVNEIEAILKAPANRPPEETKEANESEEVRNCRWKERHDKIIDLIKDHMRNFSRMPTVTELAEKTGWSRQTITKHINGFTYHPAFLREIEQFRAITNRILLVVLEKARLGDVKAARLFLKIMKEKFPVAPPNNDHTKYFLFNQTRLDYEVMQQLSPEQKNVLARYFRKAIDTAVEVIEYNTRPKPRAGSL